MVSCFVAFKITEREVIYFAINGFLWICHLVRKVWLFPVTFSLRDSLMKILWSTDRDEFSNYISNRYIIFIKFSNEYNLVFWN